MNFETKKVGDYHIRYKHNPIKLTTDIIVINKYIKIFTVATQMFDDLDFLIDCIKNQRDPVRQFEINEDDLDFYWGYLSVYKSSNDICFLFKNPVPKGHINAEVIKMKIPCVNGDCLIISPEMGEEMREKNRKKQL
jgi:hypothetical protein